LLDPLGKKDILAHGISGKFCRCPKAKHTSRMKSAKATMGFENKGVENKKAGAQEKRPGTI
jgi:hypothetical protein